MGITLRIFEPYLLKIEERCFEAFNTNFEHFQNPLDN